MRFGTLNFELTLDFSIYRMCSDVMTVWLCNFITLFFAVGCLTLNRPLHATSAGQNLIKLKNNLLSSIDLKKIWEFQRREKMNGIKGKSSRNVHLTNGVKLTLSSESKYRHDKKRRDERGCEITGYENVCTFFCFLRMRDLSFHVIAFHQPNNAFQISSHTWRTAAGSSQQSYRVFSVIRKGAKKFEFGPGWE